MNIVRIPTTCALFLVAMSLSGCDEKSATHEPWWFWPSIILVTCIFFAIYLPHENAQEKANEATMREKEAINKAKKEKLISERLDKIITSSTPALVGHQVVRNVKFISVVSYDEQHIAEIDFLSQVKAAGANAIINMKITRNGGGIFIEGDSVVAEPLS